MLSVVDRIERELDRLGVSQPEFEGDVGLKCKLNIDITIPGNGTAVTIFDKNNTLNCDGEEAIKALAILQSCGVTSDDLNNVWNAVKLTEI